MDGVLRVKKWLAVSCIVEYKVNSKTKKQKKRDDRGDKTWNLTKFSWVFHYACTN